MQQYKIDILKTVEENVKAVLKEDPILYTFNIIPLDYTVSDLTSPKVFISLNKFIFVYDEKLEAHNLNELEFEILGDEPQFKLIQQFTEASYSYNNADNDSFKRLKNDDTFTRLNYFEIGQIPKNIVLRNEYITAKPFQTWAMSQIILNIKNRIKQDPVLDEMLIGNFYKFNTTTIVLFMVVVVSYFALQFIIRATIAGIVSNIIDFLFAVVMIAMGVWTYLSLEKNNKKFYDKYLQYRPSKESASVSKIQQITPPQMVNTSINSNPAVNNANTVITDPNQTTSSQ
jgi:hypothetical protein